jgi:hypothetical protein
VIARYYEKITITRLTQLLDLSARVSGVLLSPEKGTL